MHEQMLWRAFLAIVYSSCSLLPLAEVVHGNDHELEAESYIVRFPPHYQTRAKQRSPLATEGTKLASPLLAAKSYHPNTWALTRVGCGLLVEHELLFLHGAIYAEPKKSLLMAVVSQEIADQLEFRSTRFSSEVVQ